LTRRRAWAIGVGEVPGNTFPGKISGYAMTAIAATGHRDNLKGALWMIAAMALFALEDSFVKAAATALPVGQILILFGLGGALLFAGLAKRTGQKLFPAEVLSPVMLIRAVFEVTGRLFYVLAISLTPLSAATVILQATPLAVVAGAAILFKERVGWRRWTAIAIGLTGVMIIIGPGSEGFSILSVLAVIGMLGFAGRDLASRAAPASLSTSILGFYGFLAVVVPGLLVTFWQGTGLVRPDTATLAVLAGSILSGVSAYSCLMKAMRTGEVSAVTPFRYTRLIFGIALGLLAFGESLTSTMLIGSGLIVLSGLFILWRGNRTATPKRVGAGVSASSR
jgi:drug/metabolite transporter (DMT)-like permease